MAFTGGEAGDVLELSRAQWGNEENGPDDVLVVLMREALILVGERRAGILNRRQPTVLPKPFSDYTNLGSDDEFHGHSIFVFGRDEDDTFLLTWSDWPAATPARPG